MGQVLDSACHSGWGGVPGVCRRLEPHSSLWIWVCALQLGTQRFFCPAWHPTQMLLDAIAQRQCCFLHNGFLVLFPPKCMSPCSLLSVSISHGSRMRKKDFSLRGRHSSSHTALEFSLQRKESYCQLLSGDTCFLVVTRLGH